MGKYIIMLMCIFPFVGFCQDQVSFYRGNNARIMTKTDGSFYMYERRHAGVSIFSSGKWEVVEENAVKFISSLDPENIKLDKLNDSVFIFQYLDFRSVLEDVDIPLEFGWGDTCRVKHCTPSVIVEVQSYNPSEMLSDSVIVIVSNFDNLINILPNKYWNYFASNVCELFISFNGNKRIKIKNKIDKVAISQPVKDICVTLIPDTINFIYVIGQEINFVCEFIDERRINELNIEIDRQLLDLAEYASLELIFAPDDFGLILEYPDTSFVFKKVFPKEINVSCIKDIDFY